MRGPLLLSVLSAWCAGWSSAALDRTRGGTPGFEPPALRAAARPPEGGWLDDPVSSGSRAPGDLARNRTAYLAAQTALSTYVYGIAVPLALGAEEPRILVAAPLIAAPLAFGVHLALSPRLEFTDAHVTASAYVPSAAVYSAAALSMAFSGLEDGYRLGSLIGAAAYPLGLWYSQRLGDQYRGEPDLLRAKMLFALGYGTVGMATPFLYFERPGRHMEDILRIGLGQSVGMALAGHLIADFYRPRGTSSGVPLGIATHAALGGLAGLAAAAYADASASPRPWLGAAIVGSTLGFTEGVFFFRDSRDTRERSLYSALGAAGGSMMGLGLKLLVHDGDASARAEKISWASFLVGGAWAGYWATYALTRHMTETAAAPPEPRADGPARWSFDPLPQPETVLSRGEPASRWRVPGLTMRF